MFKSASLYIFAKLILTTVNKRRERGGNTYFICQGISLSFIIHRYSWLQNITRTFLDFPTSLTSTDYSISYKTTW